MPYNDLQEFIDALDKAGELKRITVPVSSVLEISAISDRVSKTPCPNVSEHARVFDPHHCELGGPALLFENVEGSKFPLLINAFGSYRRVEIALGCEEGGSGGGFAQLAHRIEELVKPQPPVGLIEKVKKGLELAKVAASGPKVVRTGMCQEVVKTESEINLFDLPIIKCWSGDGDPQTCGFNVTPQQAGTAAGEGKYITLAGVYTIHPDDAGKAEGEPRPSRNVGMYRLQLIDRDHTAMHWHVHHDGASHWRAWKRHHDQVGDHSRGMPCAVVFGGESVLPYAATAPLPPGISELLMAGLLQRRSIPLVSCKTIDMHVPANAEMVIEGYVSTEARPPGMTNDDVRTGNVAEAIGPGAVFEGPFGDHTGFDSLPDRYPIFTVTAITHRKNPVYPTTVVGPPPQEDYYLGKATERIFLPLLQTLVPDIIDYDLPMFGCFHNCVFIKIRKEYPLQARRVMHAIWGAGQMAWTKMIIVVDEDVDVHDHEQVLFRLCANLDPSRDIEQVNGPLDILDHAAPRLGAGGKIGFDATHKIPGEEANGQPVRDWPTYLSMPTDVQQLLDQRWKEYGLSR